MRIVIGGSSGFLGSHLCARLRGSGHDVVRLVRSEPSGPDERRWDPYTDDLDPAVIAEADAVVNLAGSPLVGNVHSARWAREVQESRVTTTHLLARTIARVAAEGGTAPAFVAGNGISYYGDHGDEPLPETAESRGAALLTRVTRVWQAAAAPAVEAGARVAYLRTAPVLDGRSQPLGMLGTLFGLGLGGRLGDGSQYFPIVSLRDWVGATAHVIESADLSGPVNLCCPTAPTNAEFTQALAEARGRPARLPVPAFAIKAAAGPMAPELLNSVRAVPAALLADGYDFADQDVHAVLSAGLNRLDD